MVKFVDELKASLAQRQIHLTLSEAVIDLLAQRGYDSKMGARPLSRKIDELIRVPLSKRILFDQLTNCHIRAEVAGDGVAFETVPAPVTTTGTVDEQGIIVLE